MHKYWEKNNKNNKLNLDKFKKNPDKFFKEYAKEPISKVVLFHKLHKEFSLDNSISNVMKKIYLQALEFNSMLLIQRIAPNSKLFRNKEVLNYFSAVEYFGDIFRNKKELLPALFLYERGFFFWKKYTKYIKKNTNNFYEEVKAVNNIKYSILPKVVRLADKLSLLFEEIGYIEDSEYIKDIIIEGVYSDIYKIVIKDFPFKSLVNSEDFYGKD